MFLAAASLVLSAGWPAVWRCHREVYDLALYQGKVVAATSGGALIQYPDKSWHALGRGGPAPFRRIRTSGVSLEGLDRVGEVYELSAGTWSDSGRREEVASIDLPSPEIDFGGAHLKDPWGSRFLVNSQGSAALARDPAQGDYALLALGERLFAGTPEGIYEYSNGAWGLDDIPSNCPTLRPQGMVVVGPDCAVGGLSGLTIRRAGKWEQASKEPVRQMLQLGPDAWVLYGSGSVDKLDLVHDQIVYDVVDGGAKRPWTSCLAAFEDVILFGGQGGWIERDKNGISEHYLPEIDNDVVMAATGRGTVRWIGTQKTGLVRVSDGKVKQWNPGNGLTDTWVTALLHTTDGLVVATAGGGLFLLKGDSISPMDSPTQHPRQLALYKNRLVVGGMDGAWIRDGIGWRPLPTNNEETTALIAGANLTVCTASGVYFWGDGRGEMDNRE